MHVLWLTPDYPTRRYPMPGVYFQTQIRALARAGVTTTVISPTAFVPAPLALLSPRWRRYAETPSAYSDSSGAFVVRPRYLNIPGQPRWLRQELQIAAVARRAASRLIRADLIHAHTAMPIGGAARVLSRALRVPYLLTLHGSDVNVWPKQHPSGMGVYRQAVRDAARVFAVSQDLAAKTQDLTGVRPEVARIGVDLEYIQASALPRSDARRRLGVSDSEVLVLYVGNLIAAKGVAELVQALQRLGKPFVGLFVGDGPLLGFGASSDIRYPGMAPQPQVFAHMCAADVLVLPSRSEGLPTVVVEAGALGLPVIATAVGGVPELLAEGRGVLLNGNSAEEIAGSVEAMTRGDAAIARGGASRLRDYVFANFDADENAKLLRAAYEVAVAEGGRPSVRTSTRPPNSRGRDVAG